MSNLSEADSITQPLVNDKAQSHIDPKDEQPDTYLKESFPSRIFFNWITPLIKLNQRKTFEQDMHAKLRKTEMSETQFKMLNTHWMRAQSSKRSFPLVRAITRAYFKDLFILALLGLFSALFFFSTPIIINQLMKYIEEPKPSLKHIVGLAILIPSARIATTVIECNSWFLMNMVGTKLKYSLVSLLYSKTLSISLIRSKEHSIGSIVNLYEIDCEKVKTLMTVLQDVLITPIQILIGIGIIYYLIGTAFIAGLAVMGIVAGISYVLSKKSSVLQEQFMARKDDRMKLLSEILNGIRYIKMSGWEEAFANKLETTRKAELSVLKKRFILWAIWTVNFLLGPQGVLMATLGMFMLQGEKFDITKIITMSSTFWVLSGPFQHISWVVSTIIDSRISLRRLEKFLLSEDIDQSYITQKITSTSQVALKVTNGNFSWESTEKLEAANSDVPKPKSKPSKGAPATVELSSTTFVKEAEDTESSETDIDSSDPTKNYNFKLQDINLEVKKGSFVAIIGDIGSGKSSLFYSLCGEMSHNKENPPQITINGNVAFLPQKPWIINATLRDNITFGNPFNKQLYDKIIHYAAMESDLEILANGDLTEIGEKGINLSGGQKARVGLARALYNQPDIFLLDDVLSAVDIHVGTHIIEKCFSQYLAGKTRILITHNLDYLKYVDYIYVMEAGRIINEGSLEYLKTTQRFNELMEKNRKINKDSEEDGDSHSNVNQDETENQADSKAESNGAKHEDQNSSAKTKEKSKVEVVVEGSKKSLTEEIIEGLTVAEDREKGNIKMSTIKTFIECWGGLKFFMALFIVCVIKEIAIQGSSIYLAHWGKNPDPAEKYSYLMNFYLINLISFIAQAVAVAMGFCQALKSSKILHKRMVKSVLEAPLNLFFDRVPSGRILNRFSDDIDKIDTEAPWAVVNFTSSFMLLSIAFGICVSLSNILMIFPVLGFLAMCRYFYQGYTGLNREIQRLKSISNSPIVSHFSETLHGLSIIRSFAQQDRFLENQMKKQDESVKNLLVASGVAQWYEIRCCLASMLVIVPISVVILVWKEKLGISVGYGGVLAVYLINICGNMSWFLWEVASMEAKLISMERCHKFTLIESEKIEPDMKPSSQIPMNWPAKGEIKFSNYSTKYRPGLPLVLQQLNTIIKPAQKVGIIGRTGSGKSTLMLSLLRILEAEEGAIEVDGVRLDRVQLPHLRDKITVIPQDPQLFEGTLRENLDVLNQYSDGQLRATLESVNLNSLVNGKEGLDLKVKSGGENLSAGERQMVCIARALLKHSKIILIDEATSNIDMNSEEIFLKTVKEKFEDCTVLTIAHRLKTVINSDRIIVMGEGKIIEEGSPEGLLRNEDSVFAGMWNEAKRAKQDIIQ